MDRKTVSRKTVEAAAEGKKMFFTTLRGKFMNSPLASNIVLGLVLTALEKAVEMQFACPCNPKWNAGFSSAYFVLPGFTASVLMLVVQGCKCKFRQERENLPLFGLVPFTMWLILLFLDGQYYVCAMTNWNGSFVEINGAEHQRWCKPDNITSQLKTSQEWYFHSQAIGLGIILVYALLLMAYGAYEYVQKRNTDGTDQDEQWKDTGNGIELTETGQQFCTERDTLKNIDPTDSY